MINSVVLLMVAEIEAGEAFDWYAEKKNRALEFPFARQSKRRSKAILQNPFAFPIVHGTVVRRALLNRFPYSVIYIVDEETILIITVFHANRNPIVWRGRI